MEKGFIKKTCSFYVSEYHLVTMLLPYIKEKIDEGTSIRTMHEENIEENMEKLVTNLNLESKYKNEILNINWKAFKAYEYPEIEEEINMSDAINIIISGKYEYVEMMNKNLQKWIESSKNNAKIIINNCYDVSVLNENIGEILKKHDKLLNTSGEQDVEQVISRDNGSSLAM